MGVPALTRIAWSDAVKLPSHGGEDPTTPSECSTCHDQKPNPANPFEFLAPAFSHVLHIDDHMASCTDCHPAIDQKDFLPAKENCLACHDPAPHSFTGTKCTNCHTLDGKSPHNPIYDKHKSAGIKCESCHAIDEGKIITKPLADCKACHAVSANSTGKPRQLSLSHLVHNNQKVACRSCHPSKDGTSFFPTDQNCEKCHTSHKVPAAGCAECHAVDLNPPSGHNPLQKSHSPFGVKCENCHGIEKERLKTKKADNCITCHTASKRSQGKPNPPQFIHSVHSTSIESCQACHTDVKISGKINPPPTTLALCLNCHGQIDHNLKLFDDKSGGCLQCHSNANDPKPHGDNWIEKHGTDLLIKKEQCFDCHSARLAKGCADCHSGPSLSPAPHENGNNFRYYLHKIDARKKIVDCSTCHDQPTFCAPCHADYKRLPESHFVPGFERERHGKLAKQDPEYCASCHGLGRTCFSCHPGGIEQR